jgi:hypothetical protein
MKKLLFFITIFIAQAFILNLNASDPGLRRQLSMESERKEMNENACTNVLKELSIALVKDTHATIVQQLSTLQNALAVLRITNTSFREIQPLDLNNKLDKIEENLKDVIHALNDLEEHLKQRSKKEKEVPAK